MTGVLLIDKPEGITSFGALIKVKKIIKQKKCGHTGTLDPMATGVLTVMLGGATRFGELLPSHDKAYIAVIRLGLVTDTLDITGKVLEEKPVNSAAVDFAAALEGFKGKIMQLPPMYSAVSVNGRRLYELARKGEEVEREAREATIYSLDLLEADEEKNEYKIHVRCSAGTYIRTLADDIGRQLGCGATLCSLRRTEANGFAVDRAVTLEQLQSAADENRLQELLIPVDSALSAYGRVYVSPAQATRFKNGGALDIQRVGGIKGEGLYRVYSPEAGFIGLGEVGDGELKVKRVFVPA